VKKRPSKVERRRSILDAARAVFARHGYGSTRMSDIATHAHVGKGTLYAHFAGKDDLFATLVLVTMRESMETLTQRIPEDPETALREIIAYVMEIGLGENLDLYGLFYDFWGVAATNRGAAQARLREVIASFRGLVSETVRRGQRAGAFRPEVDPDQVARAISAFVDGLSLQIVILGEQVDLARYAAYLQDVVFATLSVGGALDGASLLREQK